MRLGHIAKMPLSQFPINRDYRKEAGEAKAANFYPEWGKVGMVVSVSMA